MTLYLRIFNIKKRDNIRFYPDEKLLQFSSKNILLKVISSRKDLLLLKSTWTRRQQLVGVKFELFISIWMSGKKTEQKLST